MSDRMAATITVPTWALHLPSIQAALAEDPADETIPRPDGTTELIQFEAPWGIWETLENALVAAGVAFDRQSDGLYEYDPETRCFRPATETDPGCDTHVLTLANGTPVVPLPQLQALAAAGPLTIDGITAALGLPAVSVAEWGQAHAPREEAPAHD